MKNKIIKLLFLLFTVVLLNNVKSQDNPGFSGKKKAIGYNLHIPFFKCYMYANNDIYFEIARSRTKSFSINLSYAPIYIKYYNNNEYNLSQFVKIPGFENEVGFSIDGGHIWLQMYGAGAKYSFFNPSKTISAPIGFSFYLKSDLFITKVISKDLEYEFDENISNSTLKKKVINDLNKNYNPTPQVTLNFGMGIETKRMISSNLLFKAHLETNLSSNLLKLNVWRENDYTYTDYLSYKCYEIPFKGNLLVGGVGLGYLF